MKSLSNKELGLVSGGLKIFEIDDALKKSGLVAEYVALFTAEANAAFRLSATQCLLQCNMTKMKEDVEHTSDLAITESFFDGYMYFCIIDKMNQKFSFLNKR
ncbi:hypothetical protein HGB13_00240 [bacterium]|nr:hypothetical protein [bacterium]